MELNVKISQFKIFMNLLIIARFQFFFKFIVKAKYRYFFLGNGKKTYVDDYCYVGNLRS